MIQFKRDDFKPMYYQLATRFRQDIQRGAIQPDDKLPPEEKLANQLGVCRSTVRNAFNKLEAEGYLFRVKGKGTFATVPKKRTKRIIVARDGIPHEIRPLHSMLAGIVSRSQESDVQVRIHTLDELKSMASDLRNNEFFTSGVIFLHNMGYDAELLDLLDRLHIPWLIQGSYHESTHNYLDLDNVSAMNQVVDHLLELGHRRFAIITQPGVETSHQKQRTAAAIARIREKNSTFDESLLFEIPHRNVIESIPPICEKIMTLKTPPTAIVCVADTFAANAILWFNHHGVPVPERISVTGFDDIPDLHSVVRPYLTTVRLDYFELGERLADAVVDMMTDYPNEKIQINIELELIKRDSTGPAPR